MRVILFEPKREFMSPAALVSAAEGEVGDEELLHLFPSPRVAVLLDRNNLPHPLANSFLAHVALRSRSATGDTVRTYAEALVRWFRFMKRRKLAADQVTEEHLAHYRNALVNAASPEGGSVYSPSTVNNRVIVAARFHWWGERSGRMPTPLGSFLCERQLAAGGQSWGGSAQYKKSIDPILPRVIQRLPRVLSREEIARLFNVVPQPYKLIFRWAVATGMRRFEVCSLRLRALPSASQIAAQGMELVPIEVLRKGGRQITVFAPAKLVEETHWYYLTARTKPARKEFSDSIFLNRIGLQYARSTMSGAFRKFADEIGSDATMHHLRHTFAVHALSILESFEKGNRSMNSLKTLQVLLGHANVTTTETYLRAVQVSSDEVRAALDYLYGATL